LWYTPFVRVIRSDTETGWWEMVSRQPAQQLRGGVRRYTGYRENSYVPHVGVPPKSLARVLRCRHAMRLLNAGDLSLARIAQECGYFDQPHFSRDFKLITGIVPARFTFLQEDPDVGVVASAP
jgi:methylphosphotriester-DNA--protein-cysteine methyltransferase